MENGLYQSSWQLSLRKPTQISGSFILFTLQMTSHLSRQQLFKINRIHLMNWEFKKRRFQVLQILFKRKQREIWWKFNEIHYKCCALFFFSFVLIFAQNNCIFVNNKHNRFSMRLSDYFVSCLQWKSTEFTCMNDMFIHRHFPIGNTTHQFR